MKRIQLTLIFLTRHYKLNIILMSHQRYTWIQITELLTKILNIFKQGWRMDNQILEIEQHVNLIVKGISICFGLLYPKVT